MATPRLKHLLVDQASSITALPVDLGLVFDDNLFDPGYYLSQNPDVADSGLDPLTHFLERGFEEFRNPSAWFSFRHYCSTNADVVACGAHPLVHYANYGWRENRDPAESFSVRKYLTAYPDVAAAEMDPLLHYMVYGRVDGRIAFHV